MSEVTKEDIAEIHKRIDKLVACNTAILVSIAKIETRFEDLVIPEMPERPCGPLREHLANHKESIRLWQRPLVRTAIDLVKMAVVAGVTWLFVRKN